MEPHIIKHIIELVSVYFFLSVVLYIFSFPGYTVCSVKQMRKQSSLGEMPHLSPRQWRCLSFLSTLLISVVSNSSPSMDPRELPEIDARFCQLILFLQATIYSKQKYSLKREQKHFLRALSGKPGLSKLTSQDICRFLDFKDWRGKTQVHKNEWIFRIEQFNTNSRKNWSRQALFYELERLVCHFKENKAPFTLYSIFRHGTAKIGTRTQFY